MRARFDDFVIDSETRQLTRGGEEIHLSPKAFAVLCALVEQRPNVVPKADLFGQIWPDVFVVDGNLNVLVGEIRRALGRRPAGAAVHPDRARRRLRVLREGDGARSRRSRRGPTGPLLAGVEEPARSRSLRATTSSAGIRGAQSGWITPACRGATHRFESPVPRRPVLTDLGSTNGTFVKGERVDGPTPLADGDVIKVGSVTVKFREWTDGASRTKRIRGAARPDS